MTFPPQGYPPQQPQGYPPQQPPTYGPPPQFPPQPAYPPQSYPQQQPYPPQAPAQPAPQTSLGSFFNQPSTGGGAAISFKDKPEGTSYTFMVARKITDADVQPQTLPNSNEYARYKDGRVKEVLVVPVLIQHPEFPDGQARWYVRGQARDELVRAMDEAGAPEGPPEKHAVITVTLARRRPVPNLNPVNEVSIVYQRPADAPAAEAPTPPQTVQQPQPVAQVPAQPQPQQPPAPQPAQQPQPVAQPQQPAMPEGLTADQQEQWRRMTGQTQ